MSDLDKKVAHAMGLKSVNNCEQWGSEVNNMGNLMDQMEADLLKQWQAITPEQRAEEERQRQKQREYEAQHTAIETEQEIDDEQAGD